MGQWTSMDCNVMATAAMQPELADGLARFRTAISNRKLLKQQTEHFPSGCFFLSFAPCYTFNVLQWRISSTRAFAGKGGVGTAELGARQKMTTCVHYRACIGPCFADIPEINPKYHGIKRKCTQQDPTRTFHAFEDVNRFPPFLIPQTPPSARTRRSLTWLPQR